MEKRWGIRPRFLWRMVDRYRRRQFEKRLAARLDFYSMFLIPGDLCFDLGANIGKKTDLFVELGARVVAVEPHPECVSVLREKYANRPEVDVVAKGVSADGKDAAFFVNRASSELSTFSSAHGELQQNGESESVWSEPLMVNTVTLDDLIETHGPPSFCKIDIEGFEHEALLGLSRPLHGISFECLPFFPEAAVRCIQRLIQLGNYRFNYAYSEENGLVSKEWLPPDAMIERIRSRVKRDPAFDIQARLTESPRSHDS